MPDILHRIGVRTPDPSKVHEALSTVDGLAAWWTEDTKGSTEVGGTLEFRFAAGGFDMEVVESAPSRISWNVVGGPDEWIGTNIHWDLRQDGDWTVVLFKHEGWREPVEFMHHCSTKWGSYLMSLKSLAETGTGAAHPHDVRIDDWDQA
ncbi:SRPBCC domain-containing protein [Actinoplanes sp. NPDC051861]|uniref:SRPBCC family protein n=1 Tax=Actinoplanes sp. NPDC051861 TaxID=3155170 RepID=UPI00342A02E1